MMRLDKYLTQARVASRSEAAILVKKGLVAVDGVTAKKPDVKIDEKTSRVKVRGTLVDWREHRYLMLNKPVGYVSSTDDPGAPVVLELLDERMRKFDFFPCGRLDRNTTGLLLLTTDGALAHRLLSPRHHVAKRYRFAVKFPLSDEDIAALEGGVTIEGGYTTMPCKIEREGERGGVIELNEGKYHQIKLMMKAVHNQITDLERISFGSLLLDPNLERGQWRELTVGEIASLEECGK